MKAWNVETQQYEPLYGPGEEYRVDWNPEKKCFEAKKSYPMLEEEYIEKQQYIANLEAQNMALRQRIEDIGKVIDELLECEADTLIALSKMRKVIGR